MHGGAIRGTDLELLGGGEMVCVAGTDVGVQQQLIVRQDAHMRRHRSGKGKFKFVRQLGGTAGFRGCLTLIGSCRWMCGAILRVPMPSVPANIKESHKN